MPEKPNSIDTPTPNTKRRQIAAILALCGALGGGCSFDDKTIEEFATFDKTVELNRDGRRSICPVKPRCVGEKIFDTKSRFENCVIFDKCKPPLKKE